MKKFTRFCVVGLSNSAISFLVFYILSQQLGVHYLLGSFIGYISGIANSFIWNKIWTFHDHSSRLLGQFIKFLAINIISLGINLLVLYTLVENIHLVKTIAQLVAMGFSTVANYMGSKIMVFVKDPEFQEI